MVTSYRPALAINRDRLAQSIVQLASIGALPNGGVRRIAYNSKDVQARRLVQDWMQIAGMTVRIDPAGNIIGRYPGRFPDAPALATGSHIDTVPMGGRYDGAFGVLAGLEVVRTLQDQRSQFDHPLEVIVFTDEEGSMIGSKAMAGQVKPDPAYYQRPDGSSIQACLDRIGGNWDSIAQARRTNQDVAAFVELHVEQGPILESMGKA
ncbi:MAG: M20/M25/M40 family metallo-hydrolase, partial [Microcoleus sp. SIO2G3]|nr:M20/M25/M40 family metallo-hydrolase [Microcoleus sp. SIO2G3]